MAAQQPTWLNRTEYPFESHFINQQGTLQHFIDTGKGDPIVFVHGTPSWSFDFRGVIKSISASNRCVAMDHIGFGLSEKPADYPYSLKNHFTNLVRLIDHLQLKNITLVVHDFGGPIGLEYALDYPENVKQLVILNSWIGSSEHEPEFQKMKKILKNPLLPFLYLHFNFSPRILMPQSFGKVKMSRYIRSQFTRPFTSRKERYGMLAFAKSLLNDQHFFEEQRRRIQLLQNKPVLLIWGLRDKFVGPAYLQRFKACFNHVQTLELNDAGHFPQEEQPAMIANAIQKFINR